MEIRLRRVHVYVREHTLSLSLFSLLFLYGPSARLNIDNECAIQRSLIQQFSFVNVSSTSIFSNSSPEVLLPSLQA